MFLYKLTFLTGSNHHMYLWELLLCQLLRSVTQSFVHFVTSADGCTSWWASLGNKILNSGVSKELPMVLGKVPEMGGTIDGVQWCYRWGAVVL